MNRVCTEARSCEILKTVMPFISETHPGYEVSTLRGRHLGANRLTGALLIGLLNNNKLDFLALASRVYTVFVVTLNCNVFLIQRLIVSGGFILVYRSTNQRN